MKFRQTRVSADHRPPLWLCQLPPKDYWSTPFAESLLSQLDLPTGSSVLDVACGNGIPTFHLAHRVGPTGRVVGIDLNEAQLVRARTCQGPYFPWLEFRNEDLRAISSDLEPFDRITGNLAFMFFRPHRKETLQELIRFLKPGGQLVLTFPSRGTFDSLWQRLDKEMASQGCTKEQQRLATYIADRPSVEDARQWLEAIRLERVDVFEQPLTMETGAGNAFLYHPLLRGGFLEDVYDCFTSQELAESVMNAIAHDIQSFMPLIAQCCVMSGWRVKP